MPEKIPPRIPKSSARIRRQLGEQIATSARKFCSSWEPRILPTSMPGSPKDALRVCSSGLAPESIKRSSFTETLRRIFTNLKGFTEGLRWATQMLVQLDLIETFKLQEASVAQTNHCLC